jgi:predicted nucleic acid-binding protein
MGMTGVDSLARFTGKRVCLDANIFIYAVEAFEAYRAISKQLFATIDAGQIIAVTSELSLAEVLVQPIAKNSQNIVAAYESLLTQRPSFEVIPVTRAVLRQSADVRATLGNKLPDAIHIATAELANCSFILSEDRALKLPRSIQRVTLAEFSAA